MERKAPVSLVVAIMMLATLGFSLAQKADESTLTGKEVRLEGKVIRLEKSFAAFESAGRTYRVPLASRPGETTGEGILAAGEEVTIVGAVEREGVAVYLVPRSIERSGEPTPQANR
jgi:hypothetical protein